MHNIWGVLVYYNWVITSHYTNTRDEQRNFTTGCSYVSYTYICLHVTYNPLCYHFNTFCIDSFINVGNLLGMKIFIAIPFFVPSCLMIMKSKLSICLCFHELLFHLRLEDSSDLCLQFLSLAL